MKSRSEIIDVILNKLKELITSPRLLRLAMKGLVHVNFEKKIMSEKELRNAFTEEVDSYVKNNLLNTSSDFDYARKNLFQSLNVPIERQPFANKAPLAESMVQSLRTNVDYYGAENSVSTEHYLVSWISAYLNTHPYTK